MRYLIIFTLLLLLASCSKSSSSAQKFEAPSVPVLTADVAVEDLSVFLEARGTLNASHTVEIKAQVNGEIKEIHFQDGQVVKEGDLLFTIDPKPYEIRVREAKAALAQNRTRFKAAEKKLERYSTLSKQDLIAPVEWDELEAQVALFEAAAEADKARLAAAELDLQRCYIYSPLNGKAGKATLHRGNLVSPASSPLVTISQVDPLVVDFSLTERELRQLPKTYEGLPMEIALTDDPQITAKATFSFLDHHIDALSGMVQASGQITAPASALLPGQSVRLKILVGTKEDAVVIPLSAIKRNQLGPYVFVVKKDDTVEMRTLELGQQEKDKIVVEKGLIADERVVTEGHLRLYPGSKVLNKSPGSKN